MNLEKTKNDAIIKKKRASRKASASSTSSLLGTSSCGPSTVMSTSPSGASNVGQTRRSSSLPAGGVLSRKEPKRQTGVPVSSSSRIPASSSSRIRPSGGRSPEISSHIRSNVFASRIVDPKSQAIVPKPRVRAHPMKTVVHNKNGPEEAALNLEESSSHTQVPIHYNGPLDPSNIYTEKVRVEFSSKSIANLAGTTCDPEQFLKPATTSNGAQTVIGSGSAPETFFDRLVDAQKLLDYMVKHMEEYYDTSRDPDAFSQRRQEMDDALWDSVAYIIPLLCRQMITQLRKEPLIVELPPSDSGTLIFGDIHGNFNDIYHIYKNYISSRRYERSQIVFLGDFVDRGPRSVEILCFVFALKLTQPNRVLLLRGNHEELKVNKKYGFKGLCTHIFQTTFIKVPVLGELIYLSFNRAFCFFPIGAVVSSRGKDKISRVFCCHGGVPSQYLKAEGARNTGWTVEGLNALMAKPVILAPSGTAEPQQLALNELLWNDPIPARFREKRKFKRKLFYRNKKRGGHCSFFTGEGLQAFLEANHLKAVIRGHQYRHCKATGFQTDFGGALVTVFSSSNYCGSERNTTGYVLVEGGEVTPKVLRTKEESAKFSNFNVFKLSIDESTREVNQVVY